MDKRSKAAFRDLKIIKDYILGTVAFAAAVSAFFVNVLHFKTETTTGVVAVLSIMFLAVVCLINRAEERQKAETDKIRLENIETRKQHEADIQYLKKMALENQRSALRTEMDNEMYRRPENHDTIIKYAYRYFVELDSDWVETEKFEAWKEAEEKAGRKVHLPNELLVNIKTKVANDK